MRNPASKTTGHGARLAALLLGMLAFTLGAEAVRAEPTARPNFLIVMADDMGFSDVGAFGGEISTPNLDGLARDGLRLTGFHTASTCSPTRAMLMTGTDHHRAGIANMAEMLTPSQRGKPGYDGHLTDTVVTVAELLRDAGYRTLMSGKWHLGNRRPEDDPARRGFERVFALLEAGHNHFGKESTPRSEWSAHYTEDGVKVELPKDFYSSDYFTDRLVEFLEEDQTRPFFAYLPFSAPHWPLQAPAAVRDRYKGRYDAGWQVLLQERVARQQQLGLLPPNAETSAPATLRDWNSLDTEEKHRQSRKMEIYAAMVDRMDWNIGRVLESLRNSGRLDNTVVVFLSDNGAAPDTLQAMFANVKGFQQRGEGEFAAWGSADSTLAYGPHWAQAATAPHRLYKSVTTEGGITSPTIIRYPGFARQQNGIDGHFATVMDIVPTVLELAGVEHPGTHYHGRTVEPLRGKSMVAYLQKKTDRVHDEDEAIGWELFGQRALRQGDWKADYVSEPNGSGRWALYDLKQDPGERHDLSAQQPGRLKRLVALWEDYARDMGVILDEQVVGPYTGL